MIATTPLGADPAAQTFRNGEIHDWYRTVWGYSDHLVAGLLREFRSPNMHVLDPFCGSGTTLVECMKHGIPSSGVDANPVSVLAASVKTNWTLNPKRLAILLDEVVDAYQRQRGAFPVSNDKTYVYLRDSGMLERGWITLEPLRKVLLIKSIIRNLGTTKAYKNALILALLDTTVRSVSNIKFGPELYCGEPRKYVRVIHAYTRRVEVMLTDLETAHESGVAAASTVAQGDARDLASLKSDLGARKFSHIICSPPYPAEHDYTRNSRLELALLEEVYDRASLRAIKRQMVRSHTKGIYMEDADGVFAGTHLPLRRLVRDISDRAMSKQHGFAKLYGRVTLEYFGGMARHLINLKPLLNPGAILAYVVGDQSSYLQVPIPTAKILGDLAAKLDFEVIETRHWRDRSTRSRGGVIEENVLLLRAL